MLYHVRCGVRILEFLKQEGLVIETPITPIEKELEIFKRVRSN